MDFSFGKAPPKNILRTIDQILQATADNCSHFPFGWYFTATILDAPETILAQGQEIRARMNVAEGDSSILMVILSQEAVRRCLGLIQVNKRYRFKNGTLNISEFKENFILIDENADLIQIESLEWKSPDRFKQSAEIRRSTLDKSEGKISKRSIFDSGESFPEIREARPYSSSSIFSNQKIQTSTPVFQSAKIDNRPSKESMNFRKYATEYADFKGRILCVYNVGKNKANHGTGYQVENIIDKKILQVVIWSEVSPIPPLIRGKVYEFTSFKVRRSQNYKISFHSHFMHSGVKELK